jgi:hypothetical protein
VLVPSTSARPLSVDAVGWRRLTEGGKCSVAFLDLVRTPIVDLLLEGPLIRNASVTFIAYDRYREQAFPSDRFVVMMVALEAVLFLASPTFTASAGEQIAQLLDP